MRPLQVLRQGLYGWIGVVVLSLSVCINVTQGVRIAALQNEIESLSARGELSVGTPVPTVFDVADVSGRHFTLDLKASAEPTILYVFSPFCSWCERNSNSIAYLAKHAPTYRMVGISLAREGLREFIERNRLQFEVYTDIPKVVVSGYHLKTTPETIIVSPAGKVLADWRGAYSGMTKSMIERFISITLPELVSPGAP